jgi:hypothetical protein
MIRTLTIAALAALNAAAASTQILILTAPDANRYRTAFAAAAARDWQAVDEAVDGVSDQSLLPTLAARRLLDPALRPTRAEFADFLAADPRHPLADEVYARARALRHATIAPPPPGRRGYINAGRRATGPAPSGLGHSAALLAAGDAAGATPPWPGLRHAAMPAPRFGCRAWRLSTGRFRSRRTHFAAAADRPPSDGWSRAGAHYWRARALIGAGRSTRPKPPSRPRAMARDLLRPACRSPAWSRHAARLFHARTLAWPALPIFCSRHPAPIAPPHSPRSAIVDVEMELRRLHADLPDTDDRAFLSLAERYWPRPPPKFAPPSSATTQPPPATAQSPASRLKTAIRLDRAVLLGGGAPGKPFRSHRRQQLPTPAA